MYSIVCVDGVYVVYRFCSEIFGRVGGGVVWRRFREFLGVVRVVIKEISWRGEFFEGMI